MSDEKKTVSVGFAAIDPYVESNIVTPEEKRQNGKDFYFWGVRNNYPDYLAGLYADCATLHSVVDGTRDYIAGNGAVCQRPLQGRFMNRKSQTAHELVKAVARDSVMYGGFAFQVIRDKLGQVCEVYPVSLRYLRSDKEGELFWYSEKWTGGYGKTDAVRYPKFIPDSREPASILYVKGDVDSVYPQPMWCAAVKSCEIERSIDEFHINNLANGFMGSYVINFNNGQPTDEVKKEIEKDVNEKFCGTGNAGRVMLSFNDNKESAVTLQKMEISDYSDKYGAITDSVRQKIFTAFRANENLFGIPTASGFNSEEYEASFKLFNRTVVRPMQQSICYAFDRIIGMDNSLSIDPFSLTDTDSNVQ